MGRKSYRQRSYTLIAATLLLSNSFAIRRSFFQDTVSLFPAGTISDVEVSGDIQAKTSYSAVTLYYKTAEQGCPSGRLFEDTYYSPNSIFIRAAFCAQDGALTFTYTTTDGKTCHITIFDGPNQTNASIKSSDCAYTYTPKKWTECVFQEGYNYIDQMKLNTPESALDISGI